LINIETQILKSIKIYTIQLMTLALVIKCGLAVIAYGFQYAGIVNPSHPLTLGEFKWSEFFSLYSNADSGWYQTIAEYGYNAVPKSVTNTWVHPNSHFAFFPLYPVMVSTLMRLMTIDFHAAAFLLSCLTLLLLAYSLISLLTVFQMDAKTAFKVGSLYLLFPLSLHCFFNYTEALFLSFMCLGFTAILQKRLGLMLLSAACLVLCRPNGLLLFFPFLLLIIEQQQLPWYTGKWTWLKQPWIWALLIMPIVLGSWMYYQWLTVGDALAFSHAQASWNKQLMFPLMALFRQGFWDYQLVSWFCVGIIIYAIWVRKQLPLSSNVLIWINLLLPLSAGSVVSMMRYSSVIFPLHVYWQKKISQSQYYPLAIICFVLIQMVLLKFWIEGKALMY
jgi:hypothetical protein